MDTNQIDDKSQSQSDSKSLEETVLEASPQTNGFDVVPDGGFAAWATVAGCFMVTVATFGYANAFGVYQDYYNENYLSDHSSSTISWIGSLSLAILFWVAPFSGRAMDSGNFRIVLLIGSILYVFGLFMLSLVQRQQYWQALLSQGLASGIGAGLIDIPCMGVLPQHFQKRLSFAMGLVASGAPIGGLCFSVMLNKLFNNPQIGFPNGVRISASIVALLLLLANFLIRVRFIPKQQSQRTIVPVLRSFLSDGAYIWVIASAFLMTTGLFFPAFYLQLYASKHGQNRTIIFSLFAILNGSGIPGRIIPSYLADRYGAFNIYLPSLLLSGASMVAILAIQSNAPALVIVTVLYGFASGGFTSLISAIAARMATDGNEVGLRLGLVYGISGFAVLIGTPIDGALLTNDFKWQNPTVFSAACVFGGFICGIMSRHIEAKRKGTHKV